MTTSKENDVLNLIYVCKLAVSSFNTEYFPRLLKLPVSPDFTLHLRH